MGGGGEGGSAAVEISLENNPFSSGSGKRKEERRRRGEEVLTPKRIGVGLNPDKSSHSSQPNGMLVCYQSNDLPL